MKNLLVPKPNRLLIQFEASKRTRKKQRIESYRTTSVEKAQKILDKRNPENMLFASFGANTFFVRTDKKLQLTKVEKI